MTQATIVIENLGISLTVPATTLRKHLSAKNPGCLNTSIGPIRISGELGQTLTVELPDGNTHISNVTRRWLTSKFNLDSVTSGLIHL
jgi:hypothetical protein